MGQELKRGTTRIIANYSRLLVTLSFGIVVVPLAIRWLGDDAFGIISLLGANIGLAGIFRQVIQYSLVRELGHAYHAYDDQGFRKYFAAVNVVAFGCTLLSIVSFAAVYMLVPYFKVPEEFIGAARWFVVGQGVYTAVMTLIAPYFNMYLVKERFIEYNLWYILCRAGNPLSVIILGYAIVIDNPVRGLALHGMLWASLSSFALLLASVFIVLRDRRLVPTFFGAHREEYREILSTFSWNTGVQVAMNLHEQIPPILLNLFGGTLANAAWGIGFRFVAYIRMCTTGVQFGSDAVSARMSACEDTEESQRQLQRLLAVQTKLTTMIALPAAATIFLYGWPIFHLWVGKSLNNYQGIMPVAVSMSKILSVALFARAVSDTWILVLYGAGFVKRYAPMVFLGGIFAPIASIGLMVTLPERMVVYAPPAVFAFILVSVHLIGVPVIAAKCLHIHASALFMSLARPLAATAFSIVVAISVLWVGSGLEGLGFSGELTRELGDSIDMLWVLVSIASFGAVYSLCSFFFVLSSVERKRLFGMVQQVLRKG